jgi:hypothetical protein
MRTTSIALAIAFALIACVTVKALTAPHQTHVMLRHKGSSVLTQ